MTFNWNSSKILNAKEFRFADIVFWERLLLNDLKTERRIFWKKNEIPHCRKECRNHRLTIHIARNATSKQFEYVLKYLSIAYRKQETPGTIHPINQLPRSRLNLEKPWNMNEETPWKDIASVHLLSREEEEDSNTRMSPGKKSSSRGNVLKHGCTPRDLRLHEREKRTLESVSVENLTNFYLPLLTIYCFSEILSFFFPFPLLSLAFQTFVGNKRCTNRMYVTKYNKKNH